MASNLNNIVGANELECEKYGFKQILMTVLGLPVQFATAISANFGESLAILA